MQQNTNDERHPLTNHAVLKAETPSEISMALHNWYYTFDNLDAPMEDISVTNADKPISKCSKSLSDDNARIPTLPQALINRILKIEGENDSRRGMLAWHSTGSGKTTCASGVMDAFWESDRQIVYASSIGALASNPPGAFKKAMKVFPSSSKRDFEDRGIVFISFARLANRILKAEKLKKLLPIPAGQKMASKPARNQDLANLTKPQPTGEEGVKGGWWKKYGGGFLNNVVAALSPSTNPDPAALPPINEDTLPPAPNNTPVNPNTPADVKDVNGTPANSPDSSFESAKSSPHLNDESPKPSPDDFFLPLPPQEKDKVKPLINFDDMFSPKVNDDKDAVESDDIDLLEFEPSPKPKSPKKRSSPSPIKLATPKKSPSPLIKSAVRSPSPIPKPSVSPERPPKIPAPPPKQPFHSKIATKYNIFPSAINISKIVSACKTCKIKSFADFVDLDKCVLIIDEVHNLFRPLPNQKAKHQYVQKQLIDPKIHPGLKLVILTATPGSSVKDVLVLLNMVRPSGDMIKAPLPDDAESVSIFKNRIRGLVSYYDMSDDQGYFPRVNDPGPIKYPMSMIQFEKYKEAYKNVKKDFRDYDKLVAKGNVGKFWSGARKYSNMMYKFDKDVQLDEFGIKIPALLDTIEKYPNQKHYVYSAFHDKRGSGQGILEIARQLEKRGYKRFGGKALYVGKALKKVGGVVKGKEVVKGKKVKEVVKGKKVKEVKEVVKGKKVKEVKEVKGKTKKQVKFASSLPTRYYVLALEGEKVDTLVKAFNDSENAEGKQIHVFLASQNFNEGLDLKAVRHVHVFEPLVTMASDTQTIGRARRFCSHSDLDHDQWIVQVHRYFTDLPIEFLAEGGIRARLEHLQSLITDEMTKTQIAAHKREIKKSEKLLSTEVKAIDQFIWEQSKNKMRDLFTIYRSMQEAAVDCSSLIKFHKFKATDKNFSCST